MANIINSTTRSNRPFTVIVEGNIGSGKTTFLEYFKKYNSVSVFAEPIELWRDCNGHNLLGNMYEDPKQWSHSFQSYVMLTMLDHHTKKTNEPIKLMERSIYSARYCFIEKMYKDGLLNGASTAVLNEWFNWLCNNASIDVDLIVYLKTSPEVVYERILRRNRQEEKSVPYEYVKDLHEMHENWLYNKSTFETPATVITLNADLDKSIIKEEYEKCEPCILHKMAANLYT